MTSISQQPVLPPQAPSNLTQAVNQAHSPSASISGTASPLGPAPVPATARSYANATKKSFPPPTASGIAIPPVAAGGQHGRSDSVPPMNGKPAIPPPAVPAVGATPAITNGNEVLTNSDHSRKPSVTISAAGATGYMPNGGPVVGKPNGGNGIQFGSINAGGSPAVTHSVPQLAQNMSSSLSVAAPMNPRITSPQTSPSPIPQPAASGGRPPSSLHGQGNGLSFGSLGGDEGNRHMRPAMAQGPLAPGPQPGHLRRESSHSAHSDLSGSGMGPAMNRGGYPPQSGRGRGYPQPYPHQMGYPSGPSFRAVPSQPRGGPNMTAQYQGQGRPLAPYPNSPHQSARSPALQNSHPVTPQMGPVTMANPHMHPQHYGGYPQHMGPPQVKPTSSSSFQPPFLSQDARVAELQLHAFHNLPSPNLSPDSGVFEHFLMMRHQNQYGMPQGYDPNYGYYAPQYGMPPQLQYMPPTSPRPPYHMPQGPQQPYMQAPYGNQQQSQPMSRNASAMSMSDRPSSSIGQPPTPITTPATSHTHAPSRGTNTPAPKSNQFQIPQRKSIGIVIKDPTTGAVVKGFDKPPASPAPTSHSPVIVSSSPTPPPRSSSHTDVHHNRTESKNVKGDEEKKKNEMRDAVAKKIEADMAEEKRKKDEEEQKAAKEKLEAEQKLVKEKEEAEAKERESAKAQMEADEKEKKAKAEAKAEAEEAERAAERAAASAKEASDKAKKEQEEEEEFARIEAEMVRKEAEAEERYQKKKQAEQEEKARKEAEAAAHAEEDMKRAEREAEEAEELRIKRLAEAEGEDSKQERESMFAALKNKDAPSTPPSDTPVAIKTPADSGTATPVSDASMPPPPRSVSAGKREKPAALKLSTSKPVEPAQPSAALQSLRSARFITSVKDVQYPPSIASPNPALNKNAPMGKFKYNTGFLVQFQQVFTEKPSEDWSSKVKDTVGDTNDSARPASARTPSLMKNPSNRPPLPSNFVMGTFGQGVGGKTLPPGTTSEQRFAMSTPGMGAPPKPTMHNPLAYNFGGRSGFPMGGSNPMSRTNSSTALSQQPASPREPSGRGRGGSKRGGRQPTRHEEQQAAKAMPLTAGADLKPLLPSSTGWKPRSVGAAATGTAGPAPGGDGHMPPDMVQRKVKASLNKMTPEKFDKITDQILEIAAQSKNETDGRTLRQVIQLTFEKATDEAHWASMYARFCKRMLESMNPEIKDENIKDRHGQVVTGGSLFRKYLLNRCQEEFERGWKMNLPEKPEGETEEAVMLSDEYYIAAAAKRRGLGLVKFIGELYKLDMLTERIMHECVKKLVDFEGIPDEAEVESLTSLLRTIGRSLDSTERGPPIMDVYFTRITAMLETPGLPSRLRFMLMDIVDLRKKGWASKEDNKGPKTIQEIREEAAAAQQEKEMERLRQDSRRGQGGGGGGGRMAMGRGDARSFSGGGQYGMMPPPDYQRNTVGMDDLRRLGSRNARQASQGPVSFGPTSMFNSRSNSGRRTLGPGGFGKGGEESGQSSRTATPPAGKDKKDDKEAATSANAFSALASLDASDEPTNPASPPSAASSPPTAKSKPTTERQRSKSPTEKGKAASKDGNAGNAAEETGKSS